MSFNSGMFCKMNSNVLNTHIRRASGCMWPASRRLLKGFSIALFLSITVSTPSNAISKEPVADRQSYKIYVDRSGVMRRSDTKEEVSYYGTNYTLPFAHAYRAIGKIGQDHKTAIDRDVAHMSRLGFNGFRLHLWDAELADSAGNLLPNRHLDLLDYLIASLEKRGIDIVLTAQTNFGNGYPEKNIDTGAFTYDFEKCNIHENPRAQKIQENYLRQLASHVNPYTGRSYGGDNAIIALEINNEPCHSGTKKEVTSYINRMAKALKKGGFDKPILYNVSHNPQVTEAYYDADIQGTTYQWYPVGLVAGHERRGNFLPAVDSYDIPWKNTIKNYGKTARLVYEFDPGDLLYSYMYPAIARTFRKEGFQWITQFAYDPTDIAKYNTEYQTHFLNLAYTPAKAVSMLIAGEAARNIPRGSDFGRLPADTLFGDFTVSYRNDLSQLNNGEKFFYSNNTASAPKDISALAHIAGHGSSPVVTYEGTGAYFLDKTEIPGVWRLEVMPDVMLTADPFEKPSLNKEVGKTVYRERNMTINLPSLGDTFGFAAVNEGNGRRGRSIASRIAVYPGVYLLSADAASLDRALADDSFIDGKMKEFVAPLPERVKNVVVHNPRHYINPEGDVEITAEIFGTADPDRVTVYPSTVSFWRDDNRLFPMQHQGGYTYTATIPASDLGWDEAFRYNIVVTEDGNDTTWPQNAAGNPLDWDFTDSRYYESVKASPSAPAILLAPANNDKNLEVAMIPEAWDFRLTPEMKAPVGNDCYRLASTPANDGSLVVKRYIGDEFAGAPQLKGKKEIVVKLGETAGLSGSEIALVGKNGATYSAPLPLTKLSDAAGPRELRIPFSTLSQRGTLIVPAPYPTFLKRETELSATPFDPEAIDFVELIVPTRKGVTVAATIEGIWLE